MLYPYLTIFSQKSNISISQNCIYFNTILFFSAFIFVATLQIPENFPENFQRDNRIVTYFSVENKNLERIILHTISSLNLIMSILNFIHLKSQTVIPKHKVSILETSVKRTFAIRFRYLLMNAVALPPQKMQPHPQKIF